MGDSIMNISQLFSTLSTELCNNLYVKGYDKEAVNSLIDELNAKPYKSELFVSNQDAKPLIVGLCVNIKPSDECLSAKTSHLLNNIITKQNIQFSGDSISRAVGWHLKCLKTCSDMILPDILHNLQCILQYNPQSGKQFINDFIGKDGFFTNLIYIDNNIVLNAQNSLQIYLISFKCLINLLTIDDNKSKEERSITVDLKENLVQIVINFLMKGYTKSQEEFMYCKVVISAVQVLTHIYFYDATVTIQTSEIVGICRYFILYGILNQNNKPEKVMPAQQTIASEPVKPNTKGGKKQKLRKPRNNAIESLKKEIPVSDRSLKQDVDNFENNAAYKPASDNYYLEPNKMPTWALTSDSDMSDVESGREAKLITLKSRVRQSAANLFLVLLKVKDKKDIFGYWWALFPDSPEPSNWLAEPNSKKTLAYCALTDPIASRRAAALSVILDLLSGSRPYLSQAELCKKWNASFIPFSVTLGNIISCMHKVLVSILDTERSHAVTLVALKCCAALVQATPYHKMQDGLISELVRATRKYLIHRDVTLQVGALITIGCVLSIDPKVTEVLKSMEKDATPCNAQSDENSDLNNLDDEEGYSDDELFVKEVSDKKENMFCFKSWILDICFKNIGWLFKGNERVRCIPSAIPVVLETLQVLSAIAFHHLSEMLKPHLTLLADVLSELLQHEHQDVVLQASRTISIMGDAIQKLEQINEPPNLKQCVYFWETLLRPLSSVLQHDASPAKAVVCDCIANIGERTFKELPSRTQMLCCALLVGSCSDADAAVRAAAVRALAMAVIYRTLREDMCFVCDCGENVLRALSESSVVVRTKAAWALANLSDALVLNMQEPDIESIDNTLLLRLLEVSIRCATDEKFQVRMNAMRALGNLLRYITKDHLARHNLLKCVLDAAFDKMLDCACGVTNMKLRWNACYALGNAMKNDVLYACCDRRLGKAFKSLCELAQDCKNLKVRINAAVALQSPWQRAQYDRHFVPVWGAVMAAFETAADAGDYGFTEYTHKDNLIKQLCATLAHLCCLLKPSDLPEILDPLVFHFDCAKSMYAQLYNKLPPESPSSLKILQAAKYVTIDLTAETDDQQQALGMLQEIFIWDT